MSSGRWAVRLSAAAEADYRQIIGWTLDRFGAAQARTYADTLSSTLLDLSAGPMLVGVRAREDIGPRISTLHVARHGRKGRHFVLFREGMHDGHPVIDVLRLLHDSMDLQRHLPPTQIE